MSSTVDYVHNNRAQSLVNAGLHLVSFMGHIISAIAKTPTAPIVSIYAEKMRSRTYTNSPMDQKQAREDFAHLHEVEKLSLSGVGRNLKNAFIDLIGVVSNLAFAVFGAPKSDEMPELLKKIKNGHSLSFAEQIIFRLNLPVEGLKTKIQQEFNLISDSESLNKISKLFSETVVSAPVIE